MQSANFPVCERCDSVEHFGRIVDPSRHRAGDARLAVPMPSG
jgi:hypothetical protein